MYVLNAAGVGSNWIRYLMYCTDTVFFSTASMDVCVLACVQRQKGSRLLFYTLSSAVKYFVRQLLCQLTWTIRPNRRQNFSINRLRSGWNQKQNWSAPECWAKKKEERGEKVWRRRANSEVKWGQNGWTLRDGREADGGFPQRCRDRKPTCWMGIMYHNHNIYSLRLRPLYQDTFVHHLELEHIHKKDIARTVAESLLVLFLSIQSLGTLQQQTLNILFTHTCRKIPNPLLTFVHLISCSDLIV